MITPVADIPSLKAEALRYLEATTTAVELETWRVKYLGRKGLVPQLLRNLKDLSLKKKRTLGPAAQTLRQELEVAYKTKWAIFQQKSGGAPALRSLDEVGKEGALHPFTLTIRRVRDILMELGFTPVEGPLVESPEYDFDKLNIPPEHPARAETDTFYLTTGQVMRTSTSPVQLRGIEQHHLRPPIKICSPGRVFRSEKIDATHSHTFHQFEGLSIDEAVTLADLKGTVETLYSKFFGQPVETRLRPHYFPFVEPALEVDISCIFCQQKGCRVCKQTGWLEVMGAGMVHPVVLRNMQIDPAEFQGFAFGGAIDRLAMLRYNVNDIRNFWSGDLKFISQFHATAV